MYTTLQASSNHNRISFFNRLVSCWKNRRALITIDSVSLIDWLVVGRPGEL
jgi:hypothetical protein